MELNLRSDNDRHWKLTKLFEQYNPHIENIDAISGALISLSLSILILNSQCKEGARDGIDIWYMVITLLFILTIYYTVLELCALSSKFRNCPNPCECSDPDIISDNPTYNRIRKFFRMKRPNRELTMKKHSGHKFVARIISNDSCNFMMTVHYRL